MKILKFLLRITFIIVLLEQISSALRKSGRHHINSYRRAETEISNYDSTHFANKGISYKGNQYNEGNEKGLLFSDGSKVIFNNNLECTKTFKQLYQEC
jgi:hypothetical protein